MHAWDLRFVFLCVDCIRWFLIPLLLMDPSAFLVPLKVFLQPKHLTVTLVSVMPARGDGDNGNMDNWVKFGKRKSVGEKISGGSEKIRLRGMMWTLLSDKHMVCVFIIQGHVPSCVMSAIYDFANMMTNQTRMCLNGVWGSFDRTLFKVHYGSAGVRQIRLAW